MEFDRAARPPDTTGALSPLSTDPTSPVSSSSSRPRPRIVRHPECLRCLLGPQKSGACTKPEKASAKGAYSLTSVALMTGRGGGEGRRTSSLQQQQQQQQHQQGSATASNTSFQSPPASVSDATSPDQGFPYQASPTSSCLGQTLRSGALLPHHVVFAAAGHSAADLRAIVGPPSPSAGQHGDWLSLFAAEGLVHRMLDDWFEKVHALAPVLHRQRLTYRLRAGEANTDRAFCALVVSVCAATTATLRRNCYGPVAVERPSYSLDWCITMYNIGTSASSMNEDGLGDMGSFHGMSEAAAGVRFLVYYRMAALDMSEQQLLKRLFWLMFAAYCSTDIFGKLSVSIVSHQENRSQLRPLALTESQLDTGPRLSAAELSPWHGDATSYVPGLNQLSDLFLTWPELRWRGGLLNIRSNLLQKFGSAAAGTRVALEHQRIVDDLLEVLYHMPQHVLEQNGNSLIPKLRDCGAAYMEQMNMGGGGGEGCGEGCGLHKLVSEGARVKLEKLLRKLDDIDCWPGPAIVVESPQSSRW
ncbi:hypothetical protein LY76DRAFT_628543 [Colletotrichum caudatum]|nr:hypothetical protein LY76DRAFT_628543 [Colletotrichum caudatum]